MRKCVSVCYICTTKPPNQFDKIRQEVNLHLRDGHGLLYNPGIQSLKSGRHRPYLKNKIIELNQSLFNCQIFVLTPRLRCTVKSTINCIDNRTVSMLN